ncbi:MAG: aminopeptidase P family N-terminal domain-containing protein [Bryobacteraceae bacterium]|nr:aminopeptidase P family N-terminal domain-containing protein [Bryobacteraceae bacterium]
MRRARLVEIEWPEFGSAAEPPAWRVSREEYAARLARLRERMQERRLTHFAVYGDREHFANIQWLTGFDPRFEEALLLVDVEQKPLLLVGNECMNYAPAAPPVAAGDIRLERHPEFSLPDQPREGGRALGEVLREFGVDAHSRVGAAGWKPLAPAERLELPSFLADELRFAAGYENVRNETRLLIELRQQAAPQEIAFFEWTNTLASEGMKRVLRAVRPGMRDYDLLEEARYNGVPLGCHMTLKCGANRASLASARGERVERGGRFSCGICYWGANCCRCGWVAERAEDLPEGARAYVEEFAGPYFEAMGAWFGELKTGAAGGALWRAIHERLPREKFGVFLNPGHLIHFEEWLSAPAYEGSQERLRSGMVMQADVIPSHPVFYSSRMEDGYLLADAALQAELRRQFPGLMERCLRRREFLRGVLGLPIHDDVLPLSNLCGIVPPFLLRPEVVFALS